MTQDPHTDPQATISGEAPTQGTTGTSTRRRLRTYLPIMVLARTTVNTSYRLVYPFLTSIARGLGLSLAGASGLITLRLVAGMGHPSIRCRMTRTTSFMVVWVSYAIDAVTRPTFAG